MKRLLQLLSKISRKLAERGDVLPDRGELVWLSWVDDEAAAVLAKQQRQRRCPVLDEPPHGALVRTGAVEAFRLDRTDR